MSLIQQFANAVGVIRHGVAKLGFHRSGGVESSMHRFTSLQHLKVGVIAAQRNFRLAGSSQPNCV